MCSRASYSAMGICTWNSTSSVMHVFLTRLWFATGCCRHVWRMLRRESRGVALLEDSRIFRKVNSWPGYSKQRNKSLRNDRMTLNFRLVACNATVVQFWTVYRRLLIRVVSGFFITKSLNYICISIWPRYLYQRRGCRRTMLVEIASLVHVLFTRSFFTARSS